MIGPFIIQRRPTWSRIQEKGEISSSWFVLVRFLIPFFPSDHWLLIGWLSNYTSYTRLSGSGRDPKLLLVSIFRFTAGEAFVETFAGLNVIVEPTLFILSDGGEWYDGISSSTLIELLWSKTWRAPASSYRAHYSQNLMLRANFPKKKSVQPCSAKPNGLIF